MLKRISQSGLAYLWVAVVVIVVDRCSKLWVIQNMSLYDSLPVLPFFNITRAHNTGAAFSFLHSASGWQNVFFISLALVVSGMMLRWLFMLSKRDAWMAIALTAVLGGAIGNVWDRLQYQYVIDFLDFYWGQWHFAIFNVADSAICVGAFMLVLGWCGSSCVNPSRSQ